MRRGRVVHEAIVVRRRGELAASPLCAPPALKHSCPLQVFVFLQMGGTPRNITVVPIGTERASVEGVKESFRAFRGEEAECFLAADRHKLLAVIEASFGDFREFDRLVRNVFEARRQKTEKLSVELTPPV